MRKDEVRNKKNISRGLRRALALTAALALMLMAKFATAPAPNVNSSTTSSVTPILRPRWDFSSKMFSFRLDKGIPLLSDFLGECGYSASSPGTYGIRKQFT